MTVLIDGTGTVLQTTSEMKPMELPKVILDYCTRNFPKDKIKRAYRSVDANGFITYEVDIAGKHKTFDYNGNLLRSGEGEEQ